MNKRSTLLFVPYLRVKAIKPSVSWVLLVVVGPGGQLRPSLVTGLMAVFSMGALFLLPCREGGVMISCCGMLYPLALDFRNPSNDHAESHLSLPCP